MGDSPVAKGGDATNCKVNNTDPFTPNQNAPGVGCFRPADAGGRNCDPGEKCCEQVNNFRTCGTSCTFEAGVGRIYECHTDVDCVNSGDAGTVVCCALGTVEAKPGCTYEQAVSGWQGSACRVGSCGAGETQLCHGHPGDGGGGGGEGGGGGDGGGRRNECLNGTCQTMVAFGTFLGYCGN